MLLFRCVGVQMYVCNKEHYGFLPVPLKAQQGVEDEEESFTHTITEALSKYCPLYNIVCACKQISTQTVESNLVFNI